MPLHTSITRRTKYGSKDSFFMGKSFTRIICKRLQVNVAEGTYIENVDKTTWDIILIPTV
jgi:hypothetical protein